MSSPFQHISYLLSIKCNIFKSFYLFSLYQKDILFLSFFSDMLILMSDTSPNIRFEHSHPSKERSGLFINTETHSIVCMFITHVIGRSINHCGILFPSIIFILLIIQLLLFVCFQSFLLFEFVMRPIQRDQRLQAIGILQTGRGQREVVNTFNVSKSVISRLWNRYQQTLNFDARPRSGRPRATTDHRIDSSETRLYEIDLKRQIKLLQTFIRLLLSELRVRRVEIMLDGPGLCLP